MSESVARLIESGCKRKKPYATLEQAEKAIRRIKKHDLYDGRELHAYKCIFCEWYHFAHTKGGK
jgi:hypothetical protein